MGIWLFFRRRRRIALRAGIVAIVLAECAPHAGLRARTGWPIEDAAIVAGMAADRNQTRPPARPERAIASPLPDVPRGAGGHPPSIPTGCALRDRLSDRGTMVWLHLGIGFLASVVLTLTGIRFGRQVRTARKAEKRYRLLAENSSDAIVCMTLDGLRSYVSPTLNALTGWSTEECHSKRWADIVHPDDRHILHDAVKQLRAGTPQVTSCFRYVCKDGSLLWMEGRARLLRDLDNSTQIISNVRDITDRRAAETQVALLNRELAKRAYTDGLTGLANRRRFDEALAEEWRHSLPRDTPLSLLMIDVDHFKLFNDRYGHQRGDDCLRMVAALAAAQLARHPGCLAARYGGEEFVVLLPGLDAADAAVLAERVLAAVRAAGIAPHAGPSAGGVATSIGVAPARPGADAEACVTTLVARADAALYEAKRRGRNRVVAHEELLRVDMAGLTASN